MKKSFTPVQVAEIVKDALLGVAKSLQPHGIQINLAVATRQASEAAGGYCGIHNEEKRQGSYGPYCYSCMVEKKKREGTWEDR